MEQVFKQSIKLGARVLSKKEVEAILPEYDQIYAHIEQFRMNAKNTSEERQDTENLKGSTQNQDYDVQNVISILGKRGSGKSSILMTIQDELVKGKYVSNRDIVFPLYEPESIDDSNDILTWIISSLDEQTKPLREQYRQVHRGNQMDRNCPVPGKTELDKKLKDIQESCILVNKQYKHILQSEFVSKDEYRERYFNALQHDGKLKMRMHAYFDEVVKQLKVMKMPHGSEYIRNADKNSDECEPLIHVFFDDIDIETHRVLKIMMTIIGVLNHPNVVVYISGDKELILQKLTVSPLIEEGINNNFFANLKVHNESILDSRRDYAVELMKKVMPMSLRNYVTSYAPPKNVDFGLDSGEETILSCFNKMVYLPTREDASLKKALGQVLCSDPRALTNVFRTLSELACKDFDENSSVEKGVSFIKCILSNHGLFTYDRDEIFDVLIRIETSLDRQSINNILNELQVVLRFKAKQKAKGYSEVESKKELTVKIFIMAILIQLAYYISDESNSEDRKESFLLSSKVIDFVNTGVSAVYTAENERLAKYYLPYGLSLEHMTNIFELINSYAVHINPMDANNSGIVADYFNALGVLDKESGKVCEKNLDGYCYNDFDWVTSFSQNISDFCNVEALKPYFPKMNIAAAIDSNGVNINRLKESLVVDEGSSATNFIRLFKITVAHYFEISEQGLVTNNSDAKLDIKYQSDLDWFIDNLDQYLLGNKEIRAMNQQLITLKSIPAYTIRQNREKLARVESELEVLERSVVNNYSAFIELLEYIVRHIDVFMRDGFYVEIADSEVTMEQTIATVRNFLNARSYETVVRDRTNIAEQLVSITKNLLLILQTVKHVGIESNNRLVRKKYTILSDEITKINFEWSKQLFVILEKMQINLIQDLLKQHEKCNEISNNFSIIMDLLVEGERSQFPFNELQSLENDYIEAAEKVFQAKYQTNIRNWFDELNKNLNGEYVEDRILSDNDLKLQGLQFENLILDNKQLQNVGTFYPIFKSPRDRFRTSDGLEKSDGLEIMINEQAEAAYYQFALYVCNELLRRIYKPSPWIKLFDYIQQSNAEDMHISTIKQVMIFHSRKQQLNEQQSIIQGKQATGDSNAIN